MTTFKSSLHKRQTTKTKKGHLVALVHGSGEITGFGGKMEALQKSAVIVWNSKNHQGTAQFKWAARFRNELALREKEQTRYGGSCS